MSVIDSLVFKDDGRPSFLENPIQEGVGLCNFCNAWHNSRASKNGIEYCAFCDTSHHSSACKAGLHDECPDPVADLIHGFLDEECSRQQKFDLSFCRGCNCFHSKPAWSVCLTNNMPQKNWSPTKRMLWTLRWEASNTNQKLKQERSLFNKEDLIRIVPNKYPFGNTKFIHHCEV